MKSKLLVTLAAVAVLAAPVSAQDKCSSIQAGASYEDLSSSFSNFGTCAVAGRPADAVVSDPTKLVVNGGSFFGRKLSSMLLQTGLTYRF